MTPVLILAFLAPMFFAASTLADSHLSNKVFKRETTLLFYGGFVSMLFLPLLFLFGMPGIPPASVMPLLILIGVIEAFWLLPYYTALRKLDTSIVNALFALGRVLVPISAFFLIGEQLSILQYVGFAMIIITSLYLSSANKSGWKISPAFWLMLGVSLLLAIRIVFERGALMEISWVALIFYKVIFGNIFAFLLFLHPPTRRDIIDSFGNIKRAIKPMVLTDLFQTLGAVTSRAALAVLPATVLVAILSMQSFFALLMGIILTRFLRKDLRESVKKADVLKKSLGYMVILMGIMLTILA